MRRIFSTALCNVAVLALCSAAALAQAPAMTKATPTPATNKAKAKTTQTAPKTDAEIQKCIQGKFSVGKFKDAGITVAVSGGAATLAGTTQNSGHKSNATQFATRCGATKVTNNITLQTAPKHKDMKHFIRGASPAKKS